MSYLEDVDDGFHSGLVVASYDDLVTNDNMVSQLMELVRPKYLHKEYIFINSYSNRTFMAFNLCNKQTLRCSNIK